MYATFPLDWYSCQRATVLDGSLHTIDQKLTSTMHYILIPYRFQFLVQNKYQRINEYVTDLNT